MSTDARNLRIIIDAALAKNGIDNYQAALDICTSVTKFIDGAEQKRDATELRMSIVDAMAAGGEAQKTKERIASELSVRLHINPSGRDWEDFIDLAHQRSKKGEDILQFITWWLGNGGKPEFWSARRMSQLWPMAFVKTETSSDAIRRTAEEQAKREEVIKKAVPPPPEVLERIRSVKARLEEKTREQEQR